MPNKSSAATPPVVANVPTGFEGLREYWQTTAPYNPRQPLESWETRYEQGKALRAKCPRERHAQWQPALDRADPLATVLACNVGREPDLIPLRMGRMAKSPFTFYRGACAVMAGDLARTPISGPQVVIDGDAHINNFGFYGTPQQDVVIDINDFDESTCGPWEWDLKRLAASVNLVGREHGLDVKQRQAAVLRCVHGYQQNARRLMPMGVRETWSLFVYAELERNQATLEQFGVKIESERLREIIKKVLLKAQRSHHENLLAKVARREAAGWRFREDPPILTQVSETTRHKVIDSLVEYGESLTPERRFMLQRYSVADVCHRVVGVGSVGLRAYLVLLFGNGDTDPLFLQVKQAQATVHAPYLPPAIARIQHHGRRVIAMQRVLQSLGDPLLGHTTIDDQHYYVRQMKNLKASVPIELLGGEPFEPWSWCCGAVLARSHARTGDIAKVAGYIGKSETFANAIAAFAEAYGTQTERDHSLLVKAIRRGEVPAIEEPDR